MCPKKRRREAAFSELAWTSQPLGVRVDLDDKEAVYALLDDGGKWATPSTSTRCSTRGTVSRRSTPQPR